MEKRDQEKAGGYKQGSRGKEEGEQRKQFRKRKSDWKGGIKLDAIEGHKGKAKRKKEARSTADGSSTFAAGLLWCPLNWQTRPANPKFQ